MQHLIQNYSRIAHPHIQGTDSFENFLKYVILAEHKMVNITEK